MTLSSMESIIKNNPMKNISKALVMFLAIIGMAFTGNKKEIITFKVSGNCEMCKQRIEQALDVKGVSFAEYNLETQMLTAHFNPKHINAAQLHTLIQNAGHDTEAGKAPDSAYALIPGCCKYREGKCDDH